MTVRRWLKNSDSFGLPEKYWPMFDHAFEIKSPEAATVSFHFNDGFSHLEDHIHRLGAGPYTTEKLEIELKEKLKNEKVANGILSKVRALFSLLKDPSLTHYHQSLVIGAIIYFISPIDLVPDMTPIVGYLDDYAVATMVLGLIGNPDSEKVEETAEA